MRLLSATTTRELAPHDRSIRSARAADGETRRVCAGSWRLGLLLLPILFPPHLDIPQRNRVVQRELRRLWMLRMPHAHQPQRLAIEVAVEPEVKEAWQADEP